MRTKSNMVYDLDEKRMVVLIDDEQHREQLDASFLLVSGKTIEEFLLSIFSNVVKGGKSEALIDIKNITGLHLAECNQLYNRLQQIVAPS